MEYAGIYQGVERRMVLVVIFFLKILTFVLCFVVAMNDLVHDVETIFHIP